MKKLLTYSLSKVVKLYIQHQKMLLKYNSDEEEKIMASRNKVVVPEARQALNQMKLEIASELGLSNYDQVDKGNLTARQNGYVGGYMTKRLVEMAQRQMSGK